MKKTPKPNGPTQDHINWKVALNRILEENNLRRAIEGKKKNVLHATRDERAAGLLRSFSILREAGFKLAPSGLRSGHVDWLMRFWQADPTLGKELRQRGSKLKLREYACTEGYIRQQLSFLRVFATWIGKPGMVRGNDYYLPQHKSAAAPPHRESPAMADVNAAVALVALRDPIVALQLNLLLAFGLRRAQAVTFCPALAEVPSHALPDHARSRRYLAFLRVKRGHQAGWSIRYTAIVTAEQQQAMDRARAWVETFNPDIALHVGKPGLDIHQAVDRFANTIRTCGINCRVMGSAPGQARDRFAADLYFQCPPVRKLSATPPQMDPKFMGAIYEEIARQLGAGEPCNPG